MKDLVLKIDEVFEILDEIKIFNFKDREKLNLARNKLVKIQNDSYERN